MFGIGDDEMITLTGSVNKAEELLSGVYQLKAHKKICYMNSTELLELADKIVNLAEILELNDIIQELNDIIQHEIELVKRFSCDLRKIID